LCKGRRIDPKLVFGNQFHLSGDFGKSQEQNIELIAKLDQIIAAFPDFPLLSGTSRKSFIGRLLADTNGNPAPVEQRLPR
jgi:dihydropteroate synthase